MYQQITVENSEVTFEVFKAAVGTEEYLIRIEQPTGDFGTSSIVDLRLSLAQLRKLANAMRNYTYPRVSDEPAEEITIKAKVPKKNFQNMQYESTPIATMAAFMKSLRVEDIAITTANTATTANGFAGNTSTQQEK